MKSPLMQFEIYELINISILNYLRVEINNLNLIIFGVYINVIVIMWMQKEEIKIIPNKMQYNKEMLYLFVYRIVCIQMGKKGLKYFPYLISIFVTIILLNIISLFPNNFAVTSHFVWSLYLSLSSCLGILILGLLKYKVEYLKIFILDLPLYLYPLMTVIEVGSYIIRAFSLGIRLTANIMAGHILVEIVGELLAYLNYYIMDMVIIVYGLILCLFFLEIGVACLQGYVFMLLITIYMNDAINLNLHA